MPEGGADLAVEVCDPGQVLLGAVIFETALPDGDGGVDPPQPERDVALLLADAGDRPGVERLRDLERGRVTVEGLRVGIEGGGCVARGLERLERLGLEPEERLGIEARLRAECRGAGEVLGDQPDDAV